MKIETTMNLGELAQRMGSLATREQAEEMRRLLVAEHDGEDTEGIEESEWTEMLRNLGC